MTRVMKMINVVVLSGLFLFVAFVIGFCIGKKGAAPSVEASVQEEPEIIIPTMIEQHVVTVEEVKAKLSVLEPIASYAKEYEVATSVEATRYFFEQMTIPFACKGKVEVGYDLAAMMIAIEGRTIYLTLPQPQVKTNHILWDSIQCEELDLVVKSESYDEMIKELKAEGLMQVEQAGIYDVANANLRMMIENFAQSFEDYDVEFVSESI